MRHLRNLAVVLALCQLPALAGPVARGTPAAVLSHSMSRVKVSAAPMAQFTYGVKRSLSDRIRQVYRGADFIAEAKQTAALAHTWPASGDDVIRIVAADMLIELVQHPSWVTSHLDDWRAFVDPDAYDKLFKLSVRLARTKEPRIVRGLAELRGETPDPVVAGAAAPAVQPGLKPAQAADSAEAAKSVKASSVDELRLERKVQRAGVLANILEWLDFGLYGFFALVFSKIFFPASDPNVALVNSFLVFGVGMAMRPIGAAFFGRMADTGGRRKALSWAIVLMALATLAIGVLPTYAQVGVGAAVLMALMRVVQGFSVGGQMGGSMAYLAEQSRDDRRGFVGSLAGFGAILGLMFANGVAALSSSVLAPQQLEAWGWRVPFLALGALILAVGMYVRKNLPESKHFLKAQEDGKLSKSPILDALRNRWRQILTAMGLTVFDAVGFYGALFFLPSYIAKAGILPLAQAQIAGLCGLGAMAVAVPIVGWLTDKLGRRPLMIAGSLGMVFGAIPLLMMVTSGSMAAAVGGFIGIGLLVAAGFAPLPTMLSELFPARERSTAVSIGYNLTLATFGAFIPAVLAKFVPSFGVVPASGTALIAAAAVTLGVSWLVEETYKKPLQ